MFLLEKLLVTARSNMHECHLKCETLFSHNFDVMNQILFCDLGSCFSYHKKVVFFIVLL